MNDSHPATREASFPTAPKLADRDGQRQSMADLLKLDETIAEISARMLRASGETLDKEISQALQTILTLCHVDRCGLMEVKEDTSTLILAHAQQDPEVPQFAAGTDMAALYPWSFRKLIKDREPLVVEKIDDLPLEAGIDRQSHLQRKTKSSLVIPLVIGHKVHHLFAAGTVKEPRAWDIDFIKRMRLLGEILVSALQRRESERQINQQFEEIVRLREQLEAENTYLRNEVAMSEKQLGAFSVSRGMQAVMASVEQVAKTGSTVLIEGETGTGKELVAHAIHRLSSRGNRTMVVVNCASLPAALVESELFGREKGAFTGALTKQVGRFELADESTLFLDEIAEMPIETQAKLLRVLQEGKFEHLGSPRTIHVDVRIIAATNRNLAEEVAQGRFRRDLFYRLNVFPIHVPPLRDRREDIPQLVWEFVTEFGERMGKKIRRIPTRDMEALMAYPWPGNVRELRNVVEHALIISKGDTLQLQRNDLFLQHDDGPLTLEEIERRHISLVLKLTRGRIKGTGGAAELLGLNPSTLHFRIRKLGIHFDRT